MIRASLNLVAGLALCVGAPGAVAQAASVSGGNQGDRPQGKGGPEASPRAQTPSSPSTASPERSPLQELRWAARHETSQTIWRARLRRFLASRRPSDPDALVAQLLHAGRLLRRFELREASAAYQALLKTAPVHARSIRAQAIFGQAQTDELRGKVAEAVGALRQLRRDYRDLRQARFVPPALRRLEQPPVRVSDRAPDLISLDLTGRSQSLATRRGRPVLLCYLSFQDAEAWKRTQGLLRAWRDGGGRIEDVLLMVVDSDSAALRRWVAAEKIEAPVIPARSGFLDPSLLAFRIAALPAGVLIGPDGTVLLRNPRLRTLRKALRVLVGG